MRTTSLQQVPTARGSKGLFLMHADKKDRQSETREPSAYQLGTNLTLRELGISGDTINDLVSVYGKSIVKSASRIAYENMQRGTTVDIYYLVEVVDRLGENNTRRLVTNKQMNPIGILQDYDIRNIRGLKVLTPKESEVTLETIASRSEILQSLSKLGLTPHYTGTDMLVFRYFESTLVH